MVTLIQAANMFGITKHQMYMRLRHRIDIGKPASIHGGRQKTVMVDIDKLNIPLPEEVAELEALYFEVSDKLGNQFNKELANKMGNTPNSVRSYFVSLRFIDRSRVLAYIKALKELRCKNLN